MNTRRFLSILVLGFSSGLPLFLTSKTLQAWLKSGGVDLGTIGLLSVLALPYSLKFLWAPLLDRFAPPFLGRRRGWIVLAQVGLALAIAGFALSDPVHTLPVPLKVGKALMEALTHPWNAGMILSSIPTAAVVLASLPILLLALLIPFLSASQDIMFDAWKVDLLKPEERGPGAALGVLGYRIALLGTGSAALILADHLSWSTVYLILAGLQLGLLVPTLFAPEPQAPPAIPQSLHDAVVRPFAEYFHRRGWKTALAALGFVVLFKWGVYLVQAMSTPFLLDLGFSQTEVGTVLGGAGLLATIAGTASGGLLMARLPVRPALWSFGILQGICGLLFWGLALHGHHLGWMTAAVISENFFIGMGTAALIAWMMGECDPRFSATQFALLSSLMAVGRDLLTAPAGFVAQAVGWPVFFLLTLLACLPGLALLAWTGQSARVTSEG